MGTTPKPAPKALGQDLGASATCVGQHTALTQLLFRVQSLPCDYTCTTCGEAPALVAEKNRFRLSGLTSGVFRSEPAQQEHDRIRTAYLRK